MVNKMKITNEWSMDLKNGYFVVSKSTLVKSGENKGEERTSTTKTFPNLICAWNYLRDFVDDKDSILHVGERLIVEERKKAGREVLRDRKQAKKEQIERKL